jgi:uncharacterized membrane protein
MTGNPFPFSKDRIVSFDVLRGLNIAAMVLVHYVPIYYPQPSTPFSVVIYAIWGYIGPLFIYLAGASTWLFLRAKPPTTLLKRGIFLFLLTLAIGIFPKGHVYIEWTLIQDIAFAFVIMAVIALISRHRLLIGTIIIMLCSFMFSCFSLNVDGVFPIFPIGIFFWVGYAYADLCQTSAAGAISTPRTIVAAVTAVALFGLGMVSETWVRGTPLALYSYLSTWGGELMMVYFLFVRVLGSRRFDGALGEFVLLMGRFSLTAYYVQQILLRLLQKIELELFIVNSFVSSIIMTMVIFVAVYIILQVWKRFNFTFSLEWMIRRL